MLKRLHLVTWASLFTLTSKIALAEDRRRHSAVSGEDLVAAVPGLEKVAKLGAPR